MQGGTLGPTLHRFSPQIKTPMTNTSIRFWDMDHTLMENDCDVSWKEFLIHKGLAPESDFALMRKFWKQYEEGVLDSDAFNAFQLREFTGRTEAEMNDLAREHFESAIRPKIYPGAFSMVRAQRESGDSVCMITATNAVISSPVAGFFGFDGFIATSLELIDGSYTGRITGRYCVGEGKISFMNEFCLETGTDLAHSFYYGDSVADIPVFKAVGHPVVVNPMPRLRDLAVRMGWPVLELSL